MENTFRGRFLDKVCAWDWAHTLVFAINVVLLVLLGMTFYLSPPEGGSAVVSGLTLVIIGGTLLVVGPLLRLCQKQERASAEQTGGR